MRLLQHLPVFRRAQSGYSRAGRTIHSCCAKRYAHPDPVRSSFLSRRRCDKLHSPFEEYHVISIIDAYTTLGMIKEAEPVFNYYRRQGHQFDVQVYDKLLFSWAEKGSVQMATFLFESFADDEVQPDFQSYAAMMILHGRMDNWSALGGIIEDMRTKNLNPQYLLHNTCLSKEHTDEITQVLKYFDITPIAPPMRKPTYPRVVRSLYRDREESPEHSKVMGHGPNLGQLFDEKALEGRMQRQFEIELQGYENVPSIAVGHGESTETDSHQLRRQMQCTIADLKKEWQEGLTDIIRKDVEDFYSVIKKVSGTKSRLLGPKHFPFLALLPAHVWAEIVIEEAVVGLLEQPDGLPINYLCRLIGTSAWCKYVIRTKKSRGAVDKSVSMYRKYMKFLCSPSSSCQPAREFWKQLDRELIEEGSLTVDVPTWPLALLNHLGAGLLDRLLDVATIPGSFGSSSNDEVLPAFYHVTEFMEIRRVGYIKAHTHLYELVKKFYTKDEAGHFRMSATLLPMLVPPQPWTSVTEGGYFVSPSTIVRCPPDTYQHHLLLKEAENLNAVLDALNFLGSAPWRINTRVLDLVIGVFNSGGNESLDVPSMMPPLPPNKEPKEMTKRERMQWKKLRNESYSLWMTMLYGLSLANHFRNEVFWLPNNMDFRGRVYPIPPHLSHLTSDVGRALLKLGVGYPLGEKGLDWLKIHMVNLHGQKKKASLKERLEYANEMLPRVMDSADRPLDGQRWWQSGDSPWQLLASCMEVTDAIRSGDPKNYVSHVAVHQDGSCNGLQHYAAMGRDILGAKQVNLSPQERPEDPYAGVAALVEEKRRGDAEVGDEIARALEGKINRKVVKQTVMTVVYGVTFVGGRQQIEKQLKDRIPDEILWDCSKYVVQRVFDSLKEMFSNARTIQDWLAESARKVSMAGRPMEWHTPLGLPVVQPYHKPYIKVMRTQMQQVGRERQSDFTRPPNTRKQRSAMPPNFVHSLDSTHMMLTALCSQRAGITFVAVHDSFWTHPCFVDTMNLICREQFVALHNEPILRDLAEFWESKFGGMTYEDYRLKGKEKHKKCQFWDPFPSIGDFDLNSVLKSTYFFS